jgi:hypothetical protein
MAISVTVNQEKEVKDTFPTLRMWAGDVNRVLGDGPLVVLFTSPFSGVPLSGVQNERLGIQEKAWSHYDNPEWKKIHSVTITSEC